MTIRNVIATAYVFENGWNIGPVIDFDWVAVQEHGVNWRNPYVKFQMPNLLKLQTAAGEITLTPDARLLAPLSNTAQGRGMLFGVASKQSLNWDIGKSPFSLNLTTYEQYNQFGTGPDGTFSTGGTGELAGTGAYLNYYGVLSLNYQPAAWVGVWASYEMDGALTRAKAELIDDGIFVDVGATFNPIPEISIMPFIDIKPKNPSFADGTSMNLWLTFSIL